MMGALRFFMASCVVLFHLTEKVPNIGILAVIFFYSISGYLITMVLHETYRFDAVSFAENRFLRLYPAYAITLAAGLAASTIDSFETFHAVWKPTDTSLDVLGNLLIFPWGIVAGTDIEQYRIVPSSWSVGVELCCYALLWAVTARSWKTALATTLATVSWYLYVDLVSLPSSLKYYPVPAAMLPFSLGALAYFISRRSARLMALSKNTGAQTFSAILIIICFMGLWAASLNTARSIFSHWTYYANMILAFASVLLINRARMPGQMGKVDKFLGDLAYPIFLGHFIYAFLIWKVLPIEYRGWAIFSVAYPVTILISVVIARYVDRPINKLRAGVRNSIQSSFNLPPAQTDG